MYIYMSKRKPKLCRMKRHDVSPTQTIFFLLKTLFIVRLLSLDAKIQFVWECFRPVFHCRNG